jgi:hypothetical protein
MIYFLSKKKQTQSLFHFSYLFIIISHNSTNTLLANALKLNFVAGGGRDTPLTHHYPHTLLPFLFMYVWKWNFTPLHYIIIRVMLNSAPDTLVKHTQKGNKNAKLIL